MVLYTQRNRCLHTPWPMVSSISNEKRKELLNNLCPKLYDIDYNKHKKTSGEISRMVWVLGLSVLNVKHCLKFLKVI